MTNLLNSQNINYNTSIAAKKLSSENKKSRCIEAPQSLPKYSIEKELNKKDEFRKEVLRQKYQKENKSKKILPKILFCLTAALGYAILKGKKMSNTLR